MSNRLSRRAFVKLATVTVASGVAGRGIAAAADPADKPIYAFPFLGDLHFDRWAHHDLDWLKREKAGDLKQIEGYTATTEKLTPLLLAEVKRQVTALRADDVAVPFVLQIGDFVEGLCGSFDLQALQFRDATATIDQAGLGAPFLITKGNHDVTGPGAPEAFDKVLLPWLAAQAKQDVRSASYVRRQGDDLFVFFDAYKPDVEWLARTLEAMENKARQVFFAIHPPVIPYNARADWHVFARGKLAPQRAKLLSLLGRYRAVVLSGHLHKYNLLTRRTPEGPIVQLAVSSVLRGEQEKPRGVLDGVGQYGPDLVKLEPQHAPDTVEPRRELLKAEAPFVERFEYADTAGYAVVKVYADRTDVDVYAGAGREPWKSRRAAEAGRA